MIVGHDRDGRGVLLFLCMCQIRLLMCMRSFLHYVGDNRTWAWACLFVIVCASKADCYCSCVCASIYFVCFEVTSMAKLDVHELLYCVCASKLLGDIIGPRLVI